MKTIKIISFMAIMVILLSTSVFAKADVNTSPVTGPNVMPPVIPGSILTEGLVSEMHMSVYGDFKTGCIYVNVSDTRVVDISKKIDYGFVYPEMTITIQRKAQGEAAFKNIGTVQYDVETHSPWLSSTEYTNGTASYADKDVSVGREYAYRIQHSYQGKTYYTLPESVTLPIEDSLTLKLSPARRVELYFSDTWKPAAGDVYKYELKRRLGLTGYKTVAQLDPEKSRYITDIIVEPVPGGIYYYIITATCTASNNSAKIGQFIDSEPMAVRIEE